jgi:SART-1 family
MDFLGGEARELERRDREKKMIQAKLKKKMLHSLQMPDLQLASEYYTNEEMTQFKKPKKKVPIPFLRPFPLLTWS